MGTHVVDAIEEWAFNYPGPEKSFFAENEGRVTKSTRYAPNDTVMGVRGIEFSNELYWQLVRITG